MKLPNTLCPLQNQIHHKFLLNKTRVLSLFFSIPISLILAFSGEKSAPLSEAALCRAIEFSEWLRRLLFGGLSSLFSIRILEKIMMHVKFIVSELRNYKLLLPL